MATLHVVSTPIGNLEDLTRRAERVLAECHRILAEDTRRTRKLLTHLGLSTPLVSLHAHNEAARVRQVLEWLDAGESLALVSDAGTPVVSDPGERVVRAAAEAGHDVVPVPGPSAVLAALAASGLPAARFTFLGFVPRKGADREALLQRIALSEETAVVFESPERLARLLRDLADRCGPAGSGDAAGPTRQEPEGASVGGVDRRVAVARELTKLHEEVFRGTLTEAARYYEEDGPVRGEVTVVVEPARRDGGPDGVDEAAARVLARALLDDGTSPSRAAREVARRLGIPRNAAYELVQRETEEG